MLAPFALLFAAAVARAEPPVYTTGVFQLVTVAGQTPTGACEVYTRLILDRAQMAGPVAFLGERHAGSCSEPLDRDARHYPLFHAGTDACGSESWTGDFLHAGKHSVRVVDHRPRRCDDAVPARVVVEETRPDGTVKTLYAAP